MSRTVLYLQSALPQSAIPHSAVVQNNTSPLERPAAAACGPDISSTDPGGPVAECDAPFSYRPERPSPAGEAK